MNIFVVLALVDFILKYSVVKIMQIIMQISLDYIKLIKNT